MEPVLVAEYDPELSSTILGYLSRLGFVVHATTSVAETLSALGRDVYATCVLDVDLPGGGAQAVLNGTRTGTSAVPLVLFSPSGSDGLTTSTSARRFGVEIPVASPFSLKLLGTLVKFGAHRFTPIASERLVVGRVVFDSDRVDALVNGKSSGLTLAEYSVCRMIAERHPGLVTTDELMQAIWQRRHVRGTKIVHTMVHRARRKLEPLNGGSPVVENRRGLGYTWIA